jgi:thiol-disulfide isomerase/thioredoxin
MDNNDSDNENLFDSLGVEQMSSKSFHNFIESSKKNNKIGLFMFYAPWCTHCVKKGPFLKTLIEKFNNLVKVHTYNSVALADTDTFCKDIKRYPTLYVVHKGNKYETRDLLEVMIALVAISNSMKVRDVIDKFRENNYHIDDKKKIDISSHLKLKN